MRRSGASSVPSTSPQTVVINPPQIPAEDPESNPETLSFWEKVWAIPQSDWWSGTHGEKGARIYLYYDAPGQQYLCVSREPFDIEWVRETYGGGAYKAILNDVNNRIVATLKFRIDGAARKKPPQSVTEADAPAPSTEQNAMLALVEMVREEQRETRALVRDLMVTRTAAPASQNSVAVDAQLAILPAVVGGVVQMFQSMVPQQRNPLDDLIKMKELLGGGSADIWAQLAKLKELGLIGGSGNFSNILAELEIVTKVADRLGLMGGGGGGKSIPELLLEKGPEILGQVRAGIADYRAIVEKQVEGARIMSTRPPAAVTPQPAAPGAQPAAVAPAPAPAPQPAAPNSPAVQPLQVEPITADVAEMTDAAINIIKAKIASAIAQGMTGDDIIGFLNIEAPALVGGFVGVSAAQLQMFFANDPILGQVKDHPRFVPAIQELADVLADMAEEHGAAAPQGN